MATLVPAVSRHEIARSIYRDIVTGNDYYYVFTGKSLPWADPDTPDVPVDVRRYLSEVHKNMLFVKRVAPGPNDVVFMIRRIDWTEGTVYTQYSDDVDLSEEDFYVITNEYNIYKCLDNNGGAPSTEMPTSTDGATSSTLRLPDGYVWKFMYQVPTLDRIRFMTKDEYFSEDPVDATGDINYPYVPVRNVSDGVYFDVNGNLGTVNIVNGGVGYLDPRGKVLGDGNLPEETEISVVTDVNGVITNVVISGSHGGFTFAEIQIRDGEDGTGPGVGFQGTISLDPETSNIINEDVVATTIPGAIYRVDVDTAGTQYTLGTTATPVGNGTGVTFEVTVEDGNIIAVDVTNPGQDYDYIDLNLSTTLGTPGSVTAHVGPHGGHGSNIARELYANTLCISTTLKTDNPDLFVGNDFRQLGIVKNLNVVDDDSQYFSGDTGTGSHIIAVSEANYAKFNIDDEIETDVTGIYKVVTKNIVTIASVAYHQIYLLYIKGSESFTSSTSMTNITTGATGITCINVTLPEFDKNSGTLVYLNNLSPISRSEQQVETVKLFLHF